MNRVVTQADGTLLVEEVTRITLILEMAYKTHCEVMKQAPDPTVEAFLEELREVK